MLCTLLIMLCSLENSVKLYCLETAQKNNNWEHIYNESEIGWSCKMISNVQNWKPNQDRLNILNHSVSDGSWSSELQDDQIWPTVTYEHCKK